MYRTTDSSTFRDTIETKTPRVPKGARGVHRKFPAIPTLALLALPSALKA